MKKRLGKDAMRMEKMWNKELQYDVACKHCGKKTAIFPINGVVKVICTWCHNYVFVNDMEEFKYRLRERINK